MRPTLRWLFLLLASVWAWPLAPAQAADEARRSRICPICRTANDQDAPYVNKSGMRFVRGAINTGFGWTELLFRPAEEVNRGGDLAAGVGKGLGGAAKRTFLGVGELFTFWMPSQQAKPPTPSDDCPICMGARPPHASSTPPPADTRP